MLRDFIPGYESDGLIPCIVVPEERSSVFRQAKENTARSGLTAIALARQAALLLLTVHGYEIPNGLVTNEFYRRALELDLRGKREHTEAILSAMGGIDKARFSRIKSLLRLSDDALELADRHDIDEKKLRYVLALPPDRHADVIRQIIDFDLSSKQVQALCENGEEGQDEVGSQEKLPTSAVRMAKVAQAIDKTSAHDLAKALLRQGGDSGIALARIHAMKSLLSETENYLNTQ